MDSTTKRFAANKQMQCVFSSYHDSSRCKKLFMKIYVKKTVSDFFKSTHEDGQYVVHNVSIQYAERFADGIAYEWFCNELYFASVKRFGSFRQTVECILDAVKQKLMHYKGRKFCVCLSIDEKSDSITVHFHTYCNELYFSDDVDGFVLPMLYMIIQT